MEPVSDISRGIIEIRESLKLTDQRLSQLKDTVKMIDQNNIETYKEIKNTIQAMSAKISTLQTTQLELQDAITRMESDMQKFAKLQDIKVLDKYLSYIDPSRFFKQRGCYKTGRRLHEQ